MIFRIATENDTAEILDIFAYYVTDTNYCFEWEIPTFDDFKQRIIEILKKYPYIVAVDNGKIIGFGYANTHIARTSYDWNATLTIYLDKNVVGKGLGSAMLLKLTSILHTQNVVNIYSCITCDNVSSIAFHKRHGFSRIAEFTNSGYKFNRWHDMCFYAKQIGEYDNEMCNFVNFSDLDNDLIENILK